jgi:hypothetical protein
MKCPHCETAVSGQAESCPACGFDGATSCVRHGDHWVHLDRLTDAAHCLSLRDRRSLEAHLDDFERRFPQVFFAVYFGVLPQGLRVAEVGFWLLNHAAFGTHDIEKRNEFGIVMVIDPAAGAACFSLGYAIEALTGQMDVNGILTRIRRFLTRSDYGEAVERAICDLDRQLRSVGRAKLRAPGSSSIHTVSSDLGLRPLRPALRSESAQPQSSLSQPDRGSP